MEATARPGPGVPRAESPWAGWPGVGLATVGWFMLVVGVGVALTRGARWVGGEPLDVRALPMAARLTLRGLLLLIDVRRHPIVFVLVALAAMAETALLHGPAALADLAFYVLIPLAWRLAPGAPATDADRASRTRPPGVAPQV